MKDRQASCIGSDAPGLSRFGDDVKRGIIQSEVEGGVDLEELPAGARLEVQTENRFYQIVNHGRGRAGDPSMPSWACLTRQSRCIALSRRERVPCSSRSSKSEEEQFGGEVGRALFAGMIRAGFTPVLPKDETG